MFAKQYRLPAVVQLDHPLTTSTLFCLIKISKNKLENNRYGFVISKAVNKRATVRNRTKRRIRACIEQLHPKLKQGHDVLMIIKKEVGDYSKDSLFLTIEKV